MLLAPAVCDEAPLLHDHSKRPSSSPQVRPKFALVFSSCGAASISVQSAAAFSRRAARFAMGGRAGATRKKVRAPCWRAAQSFWRKRIARKRKRRRAWGPGGVRVCCRPESLSPLARRLLGFRLTSRLRNFRFLLRHSLNLPRQWDGVTLCFDSRNCKRTCCAYMPPIVSPVM